MSEDAIGSELLEHFSTVPAASSKSFIESLTEAVSRFSADVLLPQSSAEIGLVAEHANAIEAATGARVLADTATTIQSLEDKWNLASALELDGSDFVPETRLCHSSHEVFAAATELGHPDYSVCVKPADAKGSRGFRIFCSPQARAEAIMRGRPDDPRLTLEEYCAALDALGEPVRVLVMEFVKGIERTVDVYCENGEILNGFVKTREGMRNGLAMRFEVVEHAQLWQSSKQIVEKFQCNFFLNIQFKGTKLLEVNPRVSTFVWDDFFNMPLMGVLHAAGQLSSKEVRRIPKPRHGVVARRYYDQTHRGENPSFFEIPADTGR